MQETFKYFKNKTKPPDLKTVIDCTDIDSDKITKIILPHKAIRKIGLLSTSDWEVFRFKSKPGLILIKNPFTAVGQRYWIRKLLKDYTKHPNPNNLLPSRFNEKVINDFWDAMNAESDEQQKRLIKKSMRWSTLGYHYDWTNKVYDENSKNEFPPELHQLIETIADCLEFKSYKSEAAIINFYPIGSTLSAHTDHSEYFLDSPLFSVSFGQSAIFLIGGREREDEVLPIILNSGDILVMSDDSRLFYHAVPCVFHCDQKPWIDSEDMSRCSDLPQDELAQCVRSAEWKHFESYLADSRINVNVRQVNK